MQALYSETGRKGVKYTMVYYYKVLMSIRGMQTTTSRGRRWSRTAGFSIAATALSLVIYLLMQPMNASAAGNPLAGAKFYLDPNTSHAARQIEQWKVSRPADAAELQKIASQPKALWMGDWTPNSLQTATDYTKRARAAGAVGIIVAYNIPSRDCGSYSAGGAASYTSYKSWIDGLASGISNRKTVVVLEPDALPQLDCLDAAGRQARLDALNYAVTRLKNVPGAIVYIDIGNKGWLSPADAAARLTQANIARADGFSLNVSNFYTTAESAIYGNDISDRIGGKRYIIDTSRNGLGSNGQWCNPDGRALGSAPSTQTSYALVDALAWVKGPGESDGTCNGSPSAGTWWPEYALGLAQRTPSATTSTPTTPSAPSGTKTRTITKPQAAVKPPTIPRPTPASALLGLQPAGSISSVQSAFASLHIKSEKSVSPRIVKNTIPVPGILSNTSNIKVSVDGTMFTGRTIDTRYLENGIHIVLVSQKVDNGTVTHRTVLDVRNDLSTLESIRNNLLSFLAINPSGFDTTIPAPALLSTTVLW